MFIGHYWRFPGCQALQLAAVASRSFRGSAIPGRPLFSVRSRRHREDAHRARLHGVQSLRPFLHAVLAQPCSAPSCGWWCSGLHSSLVARGGAPPRPFFTLAVLAAAVFSHFVLDVPVHTPDLPLGPGAGSPKIGLELRQPSRRRDRRRACRPVRRRPDLPARHAAPQPASPRRDRGLRFRSRRGDGRHPLSARSPERPRLRRPGPGLLRAAGPRRRRRRPPPRPANLMSGGSESLGRP